MMKALENDKVVQNVNHTLVFHFYLFTWEFIKHIFFPFYKMNQNTDNEEDLRCNIENKYETKLKSYSLNLKRNQVWSEIKHHNYACLLYLVDADL